MSNVIEFPKKKKPKAEDIGDRIQKIRTSFEEINKLMAELKHQKKRRDNDYRK